MIPANMRRRIPIIKVHPSISIAKGNLSTHTLTRRSTVATERSTYMAYLSTHDLTRRSTVCSCSDQSPFFSFNSRPHTEVDSSVIRLCFRPSPFNSRPHTEVDRRVLCLHRVLVLSTHDLTRRSTFFPGTDRGRELPFNSRPHTEVDCVRVSVCVLVIHNFQLTTSHGGRHAEQAKIIAGNILSTHDLTRRSTCAKVYRLLP